MSVYDTHPDIAACICGVAEPPRIIEEGDDNYRVICVRDDHQCWRGPIIRYNMKGARLAWNALQGRAFQVADEIARGAGAKR